MNNWNFKVKHLNKSKESNYTCAKATPVAMPAIM